MEGEKFLHQFTEDEFFIYLMCDMVKQYACGDIKINNMVDYWQFYKKYHKQLNWEYIQKELAAAGILDFSQRLQKLAQIWFGESDDVLTREYDAESDVYDAMESYILTGGKEGREISCKLTELIQESAKLRTKARRKERIKRYRSFTFPDLKYMEKIFPILEDAPFLMPLCWFWRSFLLTLRPVRKKIHRVVYPIKRRMAEIAENIEERHEEKMLKRMDEAVRQVMEESTSSVGQEVHEILDHEGEEPAEQPDILDILSEEISSGEPGISQDQEAQENSSTDSLYRDSAQEDSSSAGMEKEPEREVFGMQDFFMNSR